MEDEYAKADFDLLLMIRTITHEELETKRSKILEEQIKTLRSENRNLKTYWMSHLSGYVPKPSCCFSCPGEPTEETDSND